MWQIVTYDRTRQTATGFVTERITRSFPPKRLEKMKTDPNIVILSIEPDPQQPTYGISGKYFG